MSDLAGFIYGVILVEIGFLAWLATMVLIDWFRPAPVKELRALASAMAAIDGALASTDPVPTTAQA